ncbi:MAG: MFS transporter [Candidatus Gracilibacteria bacterium]|jgi:MFS family permease|nr:MFS transporter [Candidatus Gracilibacteria bacterium]
MKNKLSFLSRGINKNIILLGFVSLFTDLSSQMVFPLIPLYLTGVLGASAVYVGIIEGAAESTAAILKVVSGYWSDKIKKRKPFVLFGYTLSAISKPLFAFVNSWPFVLGVRITDRVGKGLRDAPRDALVAESTDPKNFGKSFGYQRSMDGLGSLLGAIFAFLLLPLIGFKNIFLISAIPGILAIFTIFLIKEKKHGGIKKEPLKVNFSVLSLNLKLLILSSGVFALGHFGYAFLLLKAKEMGLSDSFAILLYCLYFGVFTLLSMPIGSLSDKIGRKPMLVLGYIIFALVCLGMIFASSLISFVGLFILYGVFFSLIDGTQRAYVVDLCPKELKATALGTLQMAIGLTALPGGALAGILWAKAGSSFTFLFGIILSILALSVLVFIKKSR